MNFRIATNRTARTAALALAGVVIGSGVVYAYSGPYASESSASGWYSGGEATVPDPDKAGTLTFYNAAGTAITTGNTGAPIAFAVSSGELRSGDAYGSLFAYTPASGTAQGAWTGSQLSGTTKFTGSGATSPVGSVPNDKPFAAGASGDESLADYIGANPNTATSSALKDVYEIRLRTSSPSKGVGPAYASGFVKVSGDTWTQIQAPPLGENAVATTVTPGARAITYGTATTIPVTVTGSATPVGDVQLFFGATKIGQATLNGSGAAAIAFSRTILQPGTRVLTVKFVPSNSADFSPSQASKAYAVARAAVKVYQSLKVAPTSTANGSGLALVRAASGLPVPSGKVLVQYRRSGTSAIYKTGTLALASNGTRTVPYPKRPKGQYWDYRVYYGGSTRYLPATSAWLKVLIRK